jgi:hypothetical protein
MNVAIIRGRRGAGGVRNSVTSISTGER